MTSFLYLHIFRYAPSEFCNIYLIECRCYSFVLQALSVVLNDLRLSAHQSYSCEAVRWVSVCLFVLLYFCQPTCSWCLSVCLSIWLCLSACPLLCVFVDLYNNQLFQFSSPGLLFYFCSAGANKEKEKKKETASSGGEGSHEMEEGKEVEKNSNYLSQWREACETGLKVC